MVHVQIFLTEPLCLSMKARSTNDFFHSLQKQKAIDSNAAPYLLVIFVGISESQVIVSYQAPRHVLVTCPVPRHVFGDVSSAVSGDYSHAMFLSVMC